MSHEIIKQMILQARRQQVDTWYRFGERPAATPIVLSPGRASGKTTAAVELVKELPSVQLLASRRTINPQHVEYSMGPVFLYGHAPDYMHLLDHIVSRRNPRTEIYIIDEPFFLGIKYCHRREFAGVLAGAGTASVVYLGDFA